MALGKPFNKKRFIALAKKIAAGERAYLTSIQYKIDQEREAIRQHEENIRCLEEQKEER